MNNYNFNRNFVVGTNKNKAEITNHFGNRVAVDSGSGSKTMRNEHAHVV